MCHDPAVSDEAVKDEQSQWFCADCSRKKGIKSKTPESAKGVSWQGRSTEEVHIPTSHPQSLSILTVDRKEHT
jgi:hypothetical protein